ncbi:MAG: GIY-YIG nuclease family protein [Melioribacteraceae bacterium]|nr:GIY-YIG nuclease family protein [Melioribacteraceae bacterium]
MKANNSKYYVYAIKSLSRNYIYVGLTNNLERRISDHNKGYNRTTKPYSPFITIYTEEFNTRIEARNREKYLKSSVGKDFLRKLERSLKD